MILRKEYVLSGSTMLFSVIDQNILLNFKLCSHQVILVINQLDAQNLVL